MVCIDVFAMRLAAGTIELTFGKIEPNYPETSGAASPYFQLELGGQDGNIYADVGHASG